MDPHGDPQEADKYKPEEKRSALLAIDVRHVGGVATPPVVDAYLRLFGDPRVHGFGGVLLVGPTAGRSACLGSSCWLVSCVL